MVSPPAFWQISHLEPFGAFVDIGCGVPSLIGVDRLSISRIAHPKERLQVRVVPSAMPRAVSSRGIRPTKGPTWTRSSCFSLMLERWQPGQIVPALVTHLEPFGAFVDIGCGVPSLIGVDRLIA